MVTDPIHHTSTLRPGRTMTVEWEPLAEWHSRWVAAHNVDCRRTVMGRYATFTEARARVAREATSYLSDRLLGAPA